MANVGIGVDMLEMDSLGNPRMLWWSLNALPPVRDVATHPRPIARNRGAACIYVPDISRGQK